MKQTNLHCGACMRDFDDIKELNKHLDDCPAARNMLPLIYQLWGGNDKTGHPLSHFIQNLHKNAYLIKQYAASIVNKLPNLYRSSIHHKLCEKLELDYNKFRPFESSNIIEMLNQKEAEEILWSSLFEHAKQFIKKD